MRDSLNRFPSEVAILLGTFCPNFPPEKREKQTGRPHKTCIPDCGAPVLCQISSQNRTGPVLLYTIQSFTTNLIFLELLLDVPRKCLWYKFLSKNTLFQSLRSVRQLKLKERCWVALATLGLYPSFPMYVPQLGSRLRNAVDTNLDILFLDWVEKIGRLVVALHKIKNIFLINTWRTSSINYVTLTVAARISGRNYERTLAQQYTIIFFPTLRTFYHKICCLLFETAAYRAERHCSSSR